MLIRNMENNMQNVNNVKTDNLPLADLVKGWKRGKNRASNIKLANGRKVNIAGYCRINNICMNTLTIKKGVR